MLPVVYVHIGTKPAPHLTESIGQTRRVSPTTPIFVILSRDTAMAAEIAAPNTTIVYADTLPETEAHDTYIGSIRRRLGKKRGFWRFTTERFFLIEECMAAFNMPAVLHLESDNVIFFDVETIAATLKRLYPGLAAPFLNDDLCVPGVFYVGNCSVLADLNNYIAHRVAEEAAGMRRWYRPPFLARVRMGIKLHDMNLLADFRRLSSADRLRMLPMVPPGYRTGKLMDCGLPYSEGFDALHMIFDGAAFGQYLYGLDPNHHEAEGTVGMVNPQSCVRATDFGFDRLDLRDPVPLLDYNGARIHLASLHNHSKRRLFA